MRYSLKIAIFCIPRVVDAYVGDDQLKFYQCFWYKETIVFVAWWIRPFRYNTDVWVTDRWTPGYNMPRYAYALHASRGKNNASSHFYYDVFSCSVFKPWCAIAITSFAFCHINVKCAIVSMKKTNLIGPTFFSVLILQWQNLAEMLFSCSSRLRIKLLLSAAEKIG